MGAARNPAGLLPHRALHPQEPGTNQSAGMTMNVPILQMRGITKTFPGVKALQDVTLDVNRGEVHAICG